MWLWRADTGLWEPDPAKPLDFHANLTAIAFSPAQPRAGLRGGQAGHAARPTTRPGRSRRCPPEVAQADFTSVAFAGEEALATYRMVMRRQGGRRAARQRRGGLRLAGGHGRAGTARRPARSEQLRLEGTAQDRRRRERALQGRRAARRRRCRRRPGDGDRARLRAAPPGASPASRCPKRRTSPRWPRSAKGRACARSSRSTSTASPTPTTRPTTSSTSTARRPRASASPGC